jgi:phage FluMu protein Com
MTRDLTEQVSYLQGLTEGLNINDGGPQGKIITGILDVLNEITANIKELREDVFELGEYLDSMDEDLCELQETVIEYEDDCDHIEIECSNCQEKLYFDADVLDEEDTIEIICPRCNEVVFVNDGSFDYEPCCFEDEGLAFEQGGVNPSPS